MLTVYESVFLVIRSLLYMFYMYEEVEVIINLIVLPGPKGTCNI